MPFQHCPQCQKNTLAPNGAFWYCQDCGAAITSQALTALSMTSNSRRNRKILDFSRPLSSHRAHFSFSQQHS